MCVLCFKMCVPYADPSIAARTPSLRQIFVVRHGQTHWNVEGRMQGRLDSPLTDKGQQQAAATGQLLRDFAPVDHIYCSSSGRTIETAHIINSFVQSPLRYVDELLERDSGDWSGLTLAEIEQQFPESFQARVDDPYNARPPRGENLLDMLERAHMFLQQLFESEWQSICLVTHGVMSKVILKFYLDLTEAQCVQIRHPNDLVYRLSFSQDEVLPEYFLDGLEPRTGLLHSRAGGSIMGSENQ